LKRKIEIILRKHYGCDISALEELMHLLQPKEPKSLFNDIKATFLDFYERTKGEQYYWTAKDAGQVKQIASKIRFKIKERGMEETTELILRSFEAILQRSTSDKWITDHLSLPIINSKFNEIITYGTNTTTNQLKSVANSYQYKGSVK